MRHPRHLLASVVVALSLWSGGAFAGAVVLEMKRSVLTNVTDAAGTWQHEDGTLLKGGVVIGEFFTVRRIDTRPTRLFNTGATHITLFMSAKRGGTSASPESVTLDGAHDFTSGGFKGSVSAASSPFNWIHDADAYYVTPSAGNQTLVISWTGATELTLP